MKTNKKPVKKMQTGGSTKKKRIVLRPDYRNFKMAREYSNEQFGKDRDTPATREDSTEYKTGFIRGVRGWKPSPDRLKYEGEGEYYKMGRWEGQNMKKEALAKSKAKTPAKKSKLGSSIKKAKTGKTIKKTLKK